MKAYTQCFKEHHFILLHLFILCFCFFECHSTQLLINESIIKESNLSHGTNSSGRYKLCIKAIRSQRHYFYDK